MASISIRGIPNEVRDELAARAALRGSSLQEYLRRHLIELAQRPDAQAMMARIRMRKAQTGTRLGSENIISHRDAELH